MLIFADSTFRVMMSSHMVVDMLSVLSGSSDAAICPAWGCFMVMVAVCVTDEGVGWDCLYLCWLPTGCEHLRMSYIDFIGVLQKISQ